MKINTTSFQELKFDVARDAFLASHEDIVAIYRQTTKKGTYTTVKDVHGGTWTVKLWREDADNVTVAIYEAYLRFVIANSFQRGVFIGLGD